MKVAGRLFESWAKAKKWLQQRGTDAEIKEALRLRGEPKPDFIGVCDRCTYRAVGLCETCPQWKHIIPKFRTSGRLR